MTRSLQTATLRDTHVLRYATLLRCPVTLLVTEMERDDGFQELVRRLGERQANDARFGKGHDVWTDPIAEQLRRVARFSILNFEKQIFRQFAHRDGLTRKKGNMRLISFLCRVRGPFAKALEELLGEAFGFDPQRQPELGETQFRFGGCYFAGTGTARDRRAFLRSVLTKMVDEQAGELEWTQAALDNDAKYRAGANVALLIVVVSVLCMLGMLFYAWWC